MSTAALIDRPDAGGTRLLPYLRWAGLLALLAIEVLTLTLCFDAEHLIERGGWLAFVIQRPGKLISLSITAGTMLGLLLFGVSNGGGESRRPAGGRRPAWLWLPCQLVSYAGLAWVTRSVVEGTTVGTRGPLWMALWMGSGATTLALWMLAAQPAASWWRIVRTHRSMLLVIAGSAVAAILLGRCTTSLWGSFHSSTFWAVRGVLGLFYRDLICSPETFDLGTGRFQVTIAPQCSGFEGIGLIWAFLGACFWWFRRELRFPQAFLLIPLGTALSWIFNVLRIAALIALGDKGWDAVAVDGFHSQAGWLAFNGIALGLVVLSRRTSLFSTVAVSGHAEPAPAANPTASYVAPLLAIALTTMITGSLSESGFDRLYVARVLAGLAVLGYFRHQYTALRVSLSWPAIAIGLAVYAFWTALEPAPPTGAGRTAVSDALASMPRAWAWAWLAARSIGSVIVVPVAEELAFRGYLTRRLIAGDFRAVPDGRFTWASFLASSLLFGLLHQRWLAGSVAGMAYALAYYRRGKLIDAIAAHALTNLLITISVFATGNWHAWS